MKESTEAAQGPHKDRGNEAKQKSKVTTLHMHTQTDRGDRMGQLHV